MTKVKSAAALHEMREQLRASIELRERAEAPEQYVQVAVAMGTCGIAAGAKQVMEYMMQKADELGIQAVFTQTGCMGYCYAEPTVEVKVPGREPVVFGKVDNARAEAILARYVQLGEAVEGVVATNNK